MQGKKKKNKKKQKLERTFQNSPLEKKGKNKGRELREQQTNKQGTNKNKQGRQEMEEESLWQPREDMHNNKGKKQLSICRE